MLSIWSLAQNFVWVWVKRYNTTTTENAYQDYRHPPTPHFFEIGSPKLKCLPSYIHLKVEIGVGVFIT